MSENSSEELRLPSGEKLVLSSSPHLSAGENVRGIMLKVIIALLPAVAAGIWLFGTRAAVVILITTVACVAAEALWCALAKRPVMPAIGDLSAAVTGIILALNLPPAIPLYVPVIGAFLAIWLAKQVFGGLGCNPFNPAVVARVGLLIALPAAMTMWTPPRGMDKSYPQAEVFFGASAMPKVKEGKLDGVTCATPLSIMSATPKVLDAKKSRQAATRAMRNFDSVNTPAQLKAYFLGAIFMATDMVTSPITNWGCVVFACGCGIITSVIRIWGNYPEGVSFSILFMNALVPLIDRWCTRKPFGYVAKKEAK